MRILIPLFFNAPMGGLHHHVLASTRAMIAAGHEVTVMSKPGPFADQVRGSGATHLPTNWDESELGSDVAQACASKPDVVYCHPFASRQVGVAVAEALGVPLAAVWHGMYDDFVEQWADSVDCVIAVSDAVASHLRGRCPELADRLVVIPNAVDEAWQRQPIAAQVDGKTHIGFVCRLDEDKQFILDVFAGAVTDESLAYRDDIVWHIIGDGQERESLAAAISDAGVHTEVRWHGWLDAPQMLAAMASCDIIIAPGRSALEAMALGRPTIAIGSKHYAGVVSESTWTDIAATNFGGIGSRFDEYSHGQLTADICALVADPSRRAALGAFGAQLVDEHFRDQVSQQKLLSTLTDLVARGREPLADVRVAYAEQRARALRLREDAVLTYRRTTRTWQERTAKHEAQVERLNEAIARRDATLAAIKRNPMRLLVEKLRRSAGGADSR